MPSRPTCVAILLLWASAAGALLRRDVLPDYWTTPPPDLRSVARAEEDARPAQWELSVAEGGGKPGFRTVGRAVTESRRTADGGSELIGRVFFDSGGLLKGTPFAPSGDGPGPDEHMEVSNVCEIDPSGHLRRFRAAVRSAGDPEPLLSLDGRVEGRSIVVRASGAAAMLNWTRSFAYEPGEMIQNAIGPVDRLPGLQVGQRWETRMVSPLTGRVERVMTEVAGKHTITWDNGMVKTLEVVQHLGSISARTWVRRDGVVLRQEVPFPFVRLILERLPDRGERVRAGVTAP